MSTALARYDELCTAVAAATRIDEVKEIRDRAEAMRAYGRQAQNRVLEADAAEIRIRAERRLGELLLESEKDGGLNAGGRPSKTGPRAGPVLPTLANMGITKRLSSQAQQIASVPAPAFEARIAVWRGEVARSSDRIAFTSIVKAAKVEESRQRRVEGGGCTIDDLAALAATGYRAGALLDDPAWKFRTRSSRGDDRSANQHYDTQEMTDIVSKGPLVRQLVGADAVFFMWKVDWNPRQALEVIEAYGFEHKTTAFTWVKTLKSGDGWHFGNGYWTRANPEEVWLATRGKPKRLDAGVPQLLVSPVGEHSEKPDEINRRIERLVDGPYLELNARRPLANWQTWGNEVDRRLLIPPRAVKAAAPAAGDDDDRLDIPAFLRPDNGARG